MDVAMLQPTEHKMLLLNVGLILLTFPYPLLESNILFSVKCKCTNILYCKCGPQDKFTIAISDFDSIKPFSSPGAETLHQTSGTPYYRPPEVRHLIRQ